MRVCELATYLVVNRDSVFLPVLSQPFCRHGEWVTDEWPGLGVATCDDACRLLRGVVWGEPL